MKLKILILSLIFYLFQGSCLLGIHSSNIVKNATFCIETPTTTVPPGSELQIVLSCQIDPGWHIYWKNTGGPGIAPTFDWKVPTGIKVKNIFWPSPMRFEQTGTTSFGYENNPKWLVTLDFAQDLPDGSYPITLSLFWISCNNACVPETQQISTFFKVLHGAPKPPQPANLNEVQQQLPRVIHSSSATATKDALTIQLPRSSSDAEIITDIVLYPEEESIIPSNAKISWEINQTTIHITAPLSHNADTHLLKTGKFSGIVQLYTEHPSNILSYEVSALVTQAPLNPHIAQENLWKLIDDKTTPSEQKPTLLVFLVLAFLGGILLNVAPCVLPVIGLKILQLISYKNSKQHTIFFHGIAYTCGILTTFWILAGILYSIQYAGSVIGWGFQLQNPRFVIALIIVLFCFALNLFGVFEIGTKAATWASNAEHALKKHPDASEPSLFSSFAGGIFATIIATPCTGPFLGSVLGFAATVHPFEGLLTFSAISLGVAFPFLLITAFPRLVKLFPKPGAWMLRIKQLFGFFIIATIFWLIYVLQSEITNLSFAALSIGFLILAFGLWVYGSFTTPLQRTIIRICAKTFAFALLLAGAMLAYSSVDNRPLAFAANLRKTKDAISWKPFSEKKLNEELALDRVVFVEFTAKWCLTCQLNKLAFARADVAEAFEKYHIVPLEADWTQGNEEITRLLQTLGRNGVPVYAIFRKDQAPILLGEILTPKIIIEAVAEIGRTSTI